MTETVPAEGVNYLLQPHNSVNCSIRSTYRLRYRLSDSLEEEEKDFRTVVHNSGALNRRGLAQNQLPVALCFY